MATLVSLYLWGIGLLWVGLVCVSVIVSTLFLPARGYDPFLKRMLRVLFKLLFIPVEVEGVEKIRARRTYLYMSNHVSMFDVPILGGFVPGFVRGVEWVPHFRWPLYGLLIRRVGNIPIDRENVFSSMKSMRRAARLLSRDQSLIIMPEAHRTMDGKLRPFKRLPFLLAKQAGVDLVPISLCGLYRLNNKRSWIIRPARVKIRFGDVIPAEAVRSWSIDELRNRTRERIQELLERP